MDPQPSVVRYGIGWPLLGFVAGSAAQLAQSALWSSAVYATVLSLALACLIFVSALMRRRRLAAALVAFSLGITCALAGFAATGWRAAAQASQALAAALEGKDLQVSGVVTDMPQYRQTGVRFGFRIDKATLDGQVVSVPPDVSLSWYFDRPGAVTTSGGEADADADAANAVAGAQIAFQPAPVRAGERWQLMVRLRAPHGTLNPFAYDSELRQWERGIQAVGYVRRGPKDASPQGLGQTWRHPVELARQQVRERLHEQGLEPRSGGVVAALVLGDQAAIDRIDWHVFRQAGVAHLMSISGLHITMFAWLAVRLLAWAWRRSVFLCGLWPAPSAALLGGVLLAGAYALFSGWEVPAQRTVLMLAAITGLNALAIRWPWPQIWLLACAVVVMIDPWALLQAGFWLSFVAVGILFAMGPPGGANAQQGVLERLRALVREQALIGLALAPLSLLLFGQFSIVGFVANLFAIPWVTLLVTPLSMLGVVWAEAWVMASVTVQWLVAALSMVADLSWSVLARPQAPLVLGVLAVLGGVGVALRLPWSLRALSLVTLLPVLLWQPSGVPDGEFELIAVDIGQGNAVLIRTSQHALLYDTGPSFGVDHDAGQAILLPLLRAMAVRLDRVLLSHQDADHTGGAAAVLVAHPQAEALGSVDEAHPLQSVRAIRACAAQQRWQWDGVDFEILWPPSGQVQSGAKPNTRSCVLRIASSSASALMTGDIERKQERELVLSLGDALRADLLLVPHHGSKTSSSDAFLDQVTPQTALLQAGYRNRYGHPAAEVSQRYAQRGIDVRSTVQCGAITWQSWRPELSTCPRVQAPRYWRHQVPD